MLKYLFAFLVSSALMGCSTSYQSTTQVNDAAFLQLAGNYLNTQLVLDDNPALALTETSVMSYSLNGQQVARFPIATGKHTLKISRSGVELVNRVIYVSNANTFEVVVP